MARLDRLGPAKEVAQIGAAIGREFSYELMAAVAHRTDAELRTALGQLVDSGLAFCRGQPPQATYWFKHALVQDAAYGTLLREARRALHARVAETLETQFPEIAASQPELLAKHCTEAGLTEKAVGLWGKAGQRSLERSALVEAITQVTRALDQIATLPATAALRHLQIKLQVALITPLMHVKGYAATETKVATERARQLIEQAEALGEPLEDPLLLFSVLYGFWTANYIAFNGDVMRELAAQFLTLAEKQGATVPLMIGHRLMGTSLLCTGDIAQGRGHYNQALTLYDPAEHRPLATRFGQDVRVAILSYGSWALWFLGYPEAALADAAYGLTEAREIGQAATSMYALLHTSLPHIWCGNYAVANAQTDDLAALADEKGALFWKTAGMLEQGHVFAMTGIIILGPLRLLDRELHSVQWRRYARVCGAVPDAGGEARRDRPADDRASPYGYVVAVYGRHRARPGALQSGAHALRSCRASSAGDAIWPRRPCGYFVLSVVGSVVSWLS